MKTKTSYFASILVCLVLTTLAAEVWANKPVTIIANPGPFASIEQASIAEEKVNFWDGNFSDDDACTECFAAIELRKFLATCLHIEDLDKIALLAGETLPDSGDVFVLGSRRSNRLVAALLERAGAKCELTTDESYRIFAYPDGQRTICVIEGKSRVGTLYGTYDYLTRLGMRFYGLGEVGTVYPKEKVKLIEQLDVAENPAFLIRGFFAWHDRGNEDFFLWMARNRMNLWTAAEKEIPYLKKLGLQLTIGAHDVQPNFLDPSAEYPYNSALIEGDEHKPADPYTPSIESKGDTNGDGKLTYFEAHPEWYGLRDGQRIDDVTGWGEKRNNFCTTNDDAVTELAKNFTQGLIDGAWRYADIINFWMVDGGQGKWCQCEKCKGIGCTDRLLSLIYRVNKHMQKARAEGRLTRCVHINTLAYDDTVKPPSLPLPDDFDYVNCSVAIYPGGRCYVHTLDDPNCKTFNRQFADLIRRWAARENYRGDLWIGEYYNVSLFSSLPILYTRTMQHDVQWYQSQTARGVHYMHTPTVDWGTWTLNQCLFAALLWDPDINVNTLLDEYFRGYYPTTAQPTRAFYNHLEDAYCNLKAITQWLAHYVTHAEPGKPILPQKHLRYEPEHGDPIDEAPSLLEMVDSIHLARQKLDLALSECTDATERTRLLADQARFAYGEAMMMFYYHITRTRMFELLDNEAAAREEFANVENQAQRLAKVGPNITESYIGQARNGLNASHRLVTVYRDLRKKYAPPPDTSPSSK